jgi:hypothetical protein
MKKKSNFFKNTLYENIIQMCFNGVLSYMCFYIICDNAMVRSEFHLNVLFIDYDFSMSHLFLSVVNTVPPPDKLISLHGTYRLLDLDCT